MSPQAQGRGAEKRNAPVWDSVGLFFFFGRVPSHHESCHRSTQGRSGSFHSHKLFALPRLLSVLGGPGISSAVQLISLTTMHHLKLPVRHYRSARCCQSVLFWPSGSTHLSLNRIQEPTRPWIEPSAGLLSRLPAHMAQALFYVLHLVGKASSCRRN